MRTLKAMRFRMGSQAPISQEITIQNDGWNRFFSDLSDQTTAPNWDSGIVVTNITGLGGLYISTLNFVRHGKIVFFDLLIEPNGFIISTFGTTFFDLPNLKIKGGSNVLITSQGFGILNAMDIETPLDIGVGYIEKDTLKAFLPTFNTDKKIVVAGWFRTQGL